MLRLNTAAPQLANGTHLLYQTKSSGLLSASGPVLAAPGVLMALLVYTDGTNDGVVTIYDDPDSANGNVLAKIPVIGADKLGGELHIFAEAQFGIYCSVSGVNTQALVRYID